ncbi:MAG: hypothetical protein U9Q81_06885 [Pseudomonadota bacterium]|nr:hypothetical protein [Pseudomonadota bacterium]
MKRPDLKAVLAPLKPFQRRTVDHAFARLFLAEDSTARFLVADEVGLGKTLVARGVIGRAIEHLWDSVPRIDVVYICSNASIARSNLPKLRIGADGERSFARATRLTMLATQLAPRGGQPSLRDSRLNFVSFTPTTSFAMGQSTGKGTEREVLFHLLEPLVNRRTALMNLLQGSITRTDDWRWRLDHGKVPLDAGIAARFQSAFKARRELTDELRHLFDNWFWRHRQSWPEDARRQRNRLVGELGQSSPRSASMLWSRIW